MKFVYIAFKDVLITFRDRKALVLLLLMPLVLIFILGNALGNAFSQEAAIERFNVAVIDKDNGQMGDSLKKVLVSRDVKKIIKINYLPDDLARERVSKGELSAALVIPADFTEQVMTGKNSSLLIFTDPGSPLQASVFRSIVENFTARVSAVQVGVKAVAEVTAAQGGNPIPVVAEAVPYFSSPREDNYSIEDIAVEGKKTVSSQQYYSAGMAVMFILFSGMFGIKSIINEREKHTLARLMASNTTRFTIITGKFIGILGTGFCQLLIMIAVTSLIMKVHWGTSWFGVMVIGFSAVFATAGLSMFIAAVAPSPKSADILSSIGINIMSILGGSMIPVDQMPAAMKLLSKFTINGWALKGFLKLMQDQSWLTVTGPAAVLLGAGIVFLILGAWRLKLA